jgi:ribonuclease HI
MTVAATDGSALGNPGPGGWAWVAEDGRHAFAGARHSTNNRMELRAVYELLRAMGHDEPLTIQTDSEYVVNIFTKWLEGWRKRGMKTSSRKPVENTDLIEAIDALLNGRQVTFEWTRGHAGHPLNERADALANGAARRASERLAAEARDRG